MRFLPRSRARAELLQALHEDMALARDDMRATVADAVAVAEGRLRKELDLHDEMGELVKRLDETCDEYETHESDVLSALTRVADTYELLARRIQEDREERRLLVLAIERLAAALPAAGAPAAIRPARDRVLGGTVDAARAPQLDLTADEEQPDTPASSPTRSRRR